MNKPAIWVEMEAQPGREAEVESFLKAAAPLVSNDRCTRKWFTVRLTGSRFAVFDTFLEEEGRHAFWHEGVAMALMQHAEMLLARPAEIHGMDCLATCAAQA